MIGRLMPQVKDSRQQPKSLAHKLLEKRYLDSVWRSLVPAPRPPMRRHALCLTNHPFGGHNVYDRYTGQPLGHVLPSVSAEVLAASPGIQSWSRPDVAIEECPACGTTALTVEHGTTYCECCDWHS